MDSLEVVWDFSGNFWWGWAGVTRDGVGWLWQGYSLLVAFKLVSCIQLFQVAIRFCKRESWSTQQVQ